MFELLRWILPARVDNPQKLEDFGWNSCCDVISQRIREMEKKEKNTVCVRGEMIGI
jgi:hypothetical protein